MTFRRQVATAFTTLVVVLVLAAVSALATLRLVGGANQRILRLSEELAVVLETRVQAEQLVAVARGYLLSGTDEARVRLDRAEAQLEATVKRLHDQAHANHDRRLSRLSHVAAKYVTAIRETADLHAGGGDTASIGDVFEDRILPLRARLESAADELVSAERSRATSSTHEARALAEKAQLTLVVLLAVALVLALSLAGLVSRSLVAQYRDVERATHLAQGAAAARDELLATVSHDLRTPLTAVAMGASVLAESGVRPEQQRAVRAIANAADRMRHLIDDLLKREQLQSGTIELHLERHDAHALADAALELHRENATRKAITLANRAEHAAVVVDRERVLQVLSNLLANAIKFTPEHGSVAVTARSAEGGMTFEVEDTGIGIPVSLRPHIFDRFFQAHGSSSARERGSVGLGLYICKRIVDAHGGTIGVRSAPDRGTVVWFKIPERSERKEPH